MWKKFHYIVKKISPRSEKNFTVKNIVEKIKKDN